MAPVTDRVTGRVGAKGGGDARTVGSWGAASAGGSARGVGVGSAGAKTMAVDVAGGAGAGAAAAWCSDEAGWHQLAGRRRAASGTPDCRSRDGVQGGRTGS